MSSKDFNEAVALGDRAVPPCTCSLTNHGQTVGWILALAVPQQDLKRLLAMFDEVCSMGHGATVENPSWWGTLFTKSSPLRFEAWTTIAILKEYARCFSANPPHKNTIMFATAILDAGKWYVDLKSDLGEPKRAYTQSAHGYGDFKCCNAASASHDSFEGCPSCGSKLAGTGCVGQNGPCLQQHKKMIWCKGCLITPFCSLECKAAKAADHKEVCALSAVLLQKIGLGKVCFACGIPETASDVKLLTCVGCEAAFYCSRDCQKRDWKAGHKLDCTKPDAGEGFALRASSRSSQRPGGPGKGKGKATAK